MASSDARPVPRKNTAFRVYFPLLDADGDTVTGASGLDSEVSIDGAAFSDCTNEATEIGSSGIYYLDLTAGEMNGDAVVVQVKTSTVGAKTTPIVFYPEELGDFRVDNDAVAAAIFKLDLSTLSSEASRSLLNAVRFLRNKWTLSGGTLTVYKEDDSTSAWTASVATDAAAVPVIGSDPA